MTYKTHPPLRNYLSGFFQLQAADPDTALQFNQLFLSLVPTITDQGFRGYVSVVQNTLAGVVLQANSDSDPEGTGDYTIANSTFAPLWEFAASRASFGVNMTLQWTMYPSYFDFFNPNIGDIAVGTNVWLGSRIIPRETLTNHTAELAKLCMFQFGAVSMNIGVWPFLMSSFGV